jgi:hypothetical protein
MKKAEHDVTGNQEISEHVEMAGWGVEEATERNKSEASTSISHFFLLLFLETAL